MEEKYVSVFPNNVRSYLQNLMFDPQKNKASREISIFANLKIFLKQRNIIINTYDIPTKRPPFRNIHFDLPFPFPSNFHIWKKIFFNKQKNILICTEPPMVNPFNYMKFFHRFFIKIYTFNEELVDNKKIYIMRFPKSSLGIHTQVKKFKYKKFLVLINSNKLPFSLLNLFNAFGKELYSERIKAIEFFERNIPDNFFLYGIGWNKPKRYNLNEKLLGYKKYSTYKGKVVNKIVLLSNFKFCICFENLAGVKGYITEKIFDCFKAKCVPIYWGASNIEEYIPKECFIDFRDFGDYERLLAFLNSIDEVKYNRYIKKIEIFLKDKKNIQPWFEDGYANFFLNDVLEVK